MSPPMSFPTTPEILVQKSGVYELSLDNSALSDFRRCMRRGAHAHIDWVQLGPSNPNAPISQDLQFGTSIHLALDAWWRRAPLEEVEEGFIANYGPLASHESYNDPRRSLSAGINLLRTYNAAWVLDRENYTLLSPEFTFKVFLGKWTSPSGAPWKFFYRGRIDKVLQTSAGEIEIIDHKTTTKQNPLPELFQISQPFLGYLWATRKTFDLAPVRAWADVWVLDRQGVKPQREDVLYRPWKINEWKSGTIRQFQRIAQSLEEFLASDSYEPFTQATESCDSWFRKCPFFQLCNASPQMRNRLLKVLYSSKGSHHLDQ